MPATVRTGPGPPALLPPRSPRLGPIVWLGAPGRREDGGSGEKEKGGKREGRGWGVLVPAAGEGSPELRGGSVSQVNPEIKLFQSQHLLSSPPSPRRLRRPGKWV